MDALPAMYHRWPVRKGGGGGGLGGSKAPFSPRMDERKGVWPNVRVQTPRALSLSYCVGCSSIELENL